jgi:hypothetical protein
MSATENSSIPSDMEENAGNSSTGQTKRNSTAETKGKKTVTDEAKIRHNEIER